MSELAQELLGTLLLAATALFALWIGRQKGFFQFPFRERDNAPLSLSQTIAVFAIYFGSALFLAPSLFMICRAVFPWIGVFIDSLRFSVIAHFLLSTTIASLLALFWKTLPLQTRQAIWRKAEGDSAYLRDISIACIAWLIAYPLVACVNQALNLFVLLLFRIKELPDQTVVYFLKMTKDDPLSFLLNIIAITALAPFIEELMFRGFLQTYIRKFFSPLTAIALSSFCFAFFHFSPGQGLSNISIIGSLWAFAFFLGFVYERQGSLFASIALHSLFNILSTLSVYFLGDTLFQGVRCL